MRKSCVKSNSKKSVKKVKGMGHYPTIDKEEVDFRVTYAHENGTLAEVSDVESDTVCTDERIVFYQACTLFRYIDELKRLGCRVEEEGDCTYLYTTHTKYEWICRVLLVGFTPLQKHNILHGYDWIPVRWYLMFKCDDLNCCEAFVADETPKELLARIAKFENEKMAELKPKPKKTAKKTTKKKVA